MEDEKKLVQWRLMHGGSCNQLEKMVNPNSRWGPQKNFPSLFALIEHPLQGLILFDTGYSEHFFTASNEYPYRLYRKITPVFFQPEQSALHQLQMLGYSATDISHLILSHLHADHIAGLKDFPQATIWVHPAAWKNIVNARGVNALRKAFLPDLIPSDIEARLKWIDEPLATPLGLSFTPFSQGYDLFQDSSLIAVNLPGHAIGQIGLFFWSQPSQPIFLIADCCWDQIAFQDLIYPHRLTSLLHANYSVYKQSLQKVHQYHCAHPKTEIIPSHCLTTWETYQQKMKEAKTW